MKPRFLLAGLALCLGGFAHAQQARVNVGHLAPFDADIAGTAVSVNVNGSEVASGVTFNQFSGYLGVAPGNTTVDVFAPPGGMMAAITDSFDLVADTDYTVLALGDGTNQGLSLLALEDDNSAPAAGFARLRIVHAAPFADTLPGTAVSIRFDDGSLVGTLSNVEFGGDSGFLDLAAGEYDLQVASPDGTQTFINIAPVTLNDGDVVTVFAVGDITNQPLGATAAFGDGSFAPLPLESRVNVGHLAPFDAMLSGTEVSVSVNGTEVAPSVTFNQFSDYLPVVEGSNQVDVFAPPGAMMAAISETFDLAAATDFTVLAIGDGTNQPLELLPLEDDNSAPSAGNAKLRVVHAAPFAAEIADTAVSIRLDSGAIVNSLASVLYSEDSGFFELAAGDYDLQVASPDGTQAFINLAPITLADGDIVTVFAVGDGANQALGATAFFANGTVASLPLEPTARVNVGHLAPFARDIAGTAVSVNLNDAEVASGVVFQQFSGYLPVDAVSTDVDIFAPPGSGGAPAISGTANLLEDIDYTVLAIGDGPNQALDLLVLTDENTPPTAGNAKLRVVHAAPFAATGPATAVSIRLDDGTVVENLTSVEYGADSGFFELTAGEYDLQVASPDGTQTFIDLQPVTLADGDVVTIFAVGDGANRPLGAVAFFANGQFATLPLAPVFANGFETARVNVGHLAPFANTLPGTAVSVEVNGTEVIPNVEFNVFSGYLEVVPGETTVDVLAPPATPPAAITTTTTLDPATDYTVLALGDGPNQMLTLLPLIDDNRPPAAGNVKIRVVHAAPFSDTLAGTAVSIRLDDGTVVNGLGNVEFLGESGFFQLPAAEYDLQIASPDGTQTFIDLAPVDLPAGTIVTIFAVGDGANQDLGATAFFPDGTFSALPLE
ncbi:MAG: DUF4397 domain-containing protein [Pseudomonadota bacterium]